MIDEPMKAILINLLI